MLKTAYQLGVLQALQEENLPDDQFVKFAQDLGIDIEKLALGGLLGGLGSLAGRVGGFAMKHPTLSKTLGGAALGGTVAGATGGNVLGGMALGGAGGYGLAKAPGIGAKLTKLGPKGTENVLRTGYLAGKAKALA